MLASLARPGSVAVDAGGVVYIADTDNHRIRRIAAGLIATIAGNGEESFGGDGGAATLASLDSPSGVAVDSAGNVYVADRHNQRVRRVDQAGVIATVAGRGSLGLAGSFAGDGGNATDASLDRPGMISLDRAGNLYIADTGNQRVRQVGGETISTVAGTGEQGSSGDGGLATEAMLNTPRSLAIDSAGNLLIADTLNQRLRAAPLATLRFLSQMVGTGSTPQNIVIASSAGGPVTVSSLLFSGDFAAVDGGNCPALPMTIAAGSSCTQEIGFLPGRTGSAAGSVRVMGGA